MKKIYAFLLMTILAMAGVTSRAQTTEPQLTVTVEINDQNLATVVPYYYPGGTSLSAITFTNNTADVSFYGTYKGMNKLFVTPVTPSGSQEIYFTEYSIYDGDGELLKNVKLEKKVKTEVAIPTPDADGGRVVLTCGPLPDKNLTFNLTGDPAKVNMSIDGVGYALNVGETKYAVPANTGYVTIRPVGVASLYSVKCNGTPVNITVSGLEGVTDYYYSVNKPADGDVIDIETDYPDKECTVAFDCNVNDFIQSVKVNFEKVDDWSDLKVKAGDFVEVLGDAYKYKVVSCGINDQTFDYTSNELSATVSDDITFKFTVEEIERTGQFVFYTPGGEWLLVNSNRNNITPTGGYLTLGISPSENPLSLNCVTPPEGVNVNNAKYFIYVNDERQGDAEDAYFTLNIADGDVVKAFAGTSAPSSYTVSFDVHGLEGFPIVKKDVITTIASGEDQKVLTGTEITIQAAAGQKISSVKAGDTPIEAVDGVYTCTITANTTIAIEGEAASGNNITVKANIPEGLFIRYADEYEFEASTEGAVYNLDDYETEFDPTLVVYAKTGYTVKSFLYNDTEVTGDESYDWGGGQFYFGEIKGGDTFAVELEQIPVVKGNLTVYISGLGNTDGIALAECTGMEFIADNLAAGYNTVEFTNLQTPLGVYIKGYENEMTQANAFVYLNNEKVPYQWGWDIDCKDGDVLKIYVQAVEPQKHTVSYTVEGLEGTPVIKHDQVTVISDPSSHEVLPGTEVSIAGAEGQTIGSVTVDGAAVPATEGVYTFNVGDADCNVVISDQVPAGNNITVKANIPEGVMLRYADDYVFDATAEGAVYNLDDYDAEFGQYMVVYANTGYTIKSFLYNGAEICGNEDYEWGAGVQYYFSQIKGGDTFVMEVEEIPVVYGELEVYVSGVENTTGISLTDAMGMEFVAENLEAGYNSVSFTNLQTPLGVFVTSYENEMTKDNTFVYLNNEKVGFSYGWEIDCKDGDVLKIYVQAEEPQMHKVNYTVNGEGCSPVVKHDRVTLISEPTSHDVLPGTRVTITAPDNKQTIESVTVNGTAVEPSYGMYIFEVADADCDVVIDMAKVTKGSITVKANLPEGLSIRYSDDYVLEGSPEGTVYNLEDYDAEWGETLMVFTETGYTVTSFLYNGTEVIGDDNYDWGGGRFYFDPIKGGDTFDVTVEAIPVVTGTLKVFVSGQQYTTGISLAECTGMEFIAENLPEGYSTVEFTNLQTPLGIFIPSFVDGMDMSNVYVFLNDEKVPYQWGWDINCEDGDMLRIYVSTKEPKPVYVEYQINGGESSDIVVKHDIDTEIAEPSKHQVMPGTQVTIAAAAGKEIKQVLLNSTEIAAVDGVYTLRVNEHSIVTVNFATDGVNDITADGEGVNAVYNLQGVRMSSDVKTLPAGIYIVNGRKVIVK